MRTTPAVALLSLVMAAACADDDGKKRDDAGNTPVDTDGDGIFDDDETAMGTDPTLTDSDGDGLDDGFEVNDLGTDPLSTDSDGDGYADGDEVSMGSDPGDATSGIYIGGWPYQADKDAYDDPDNYSNQYMEIGDQLPRIVAVDQFGDEVDLYDFAATGVPILVDVSAVWCGPCNGMASFLSDKGDDYGFGTYFPALPDLIETGTIRWITILGQNRQGGTPTPDTVAAWYNKYPDTDIPVLTDDGTYEALVGWWPTFVLVDSETMTVVSSAEGDVDRYMEALFTVEDEYGR